MRVVDINRNIVLFGKALLSCCYHVFNKNPPQFEASSFLPSLSAVDSGILPVPGDASNETLCNGHVVPVTASCLEVYSEWQRDSRPPSLLILTSCLPGGLRRGEETAECLCTERYANLH